MDRRNFIALCGHLSAITVLARSASPASANNLTPAPATVAAPAPAEPAPPPPPAPPTPAPGPLAPTSAPFSEDWLQELARTMASAPFDDSDLRLPDDLKSLNYDQYRSIRFLKDKAVWANDGVGLSLEMFQSGYIYGNLVRVHLVENGVATEFPYDPTLFTYGPDVKAPAPGSPGGYSGFRAHAPINRAGRLDEYVVFQGASYFRSFASGQEYGISARGLAVNTAQFPGEEFPLFRGFWVLKPKKGDERLTVFALLDSKSVTGVYKFVISHRVDTVMEIEATLHSRLKIPFAGVAPLTSMFHSGPSDLTKYPDYRPQVFDSEGLQIWNGGGEHIWRPLINPERLQFSSFSDENPKGFGLIIRDRQFTNYQDLQVRYEKRPSAWVEPIGDWGPGFVDLIELPTPTEYNDNIVAFWRPREPLEPGKTYRYAYRLYWCWDAPIRRNFAYVTQTRVASAGQPGWHSFHLDFANTGLYDFCVETEPCGDKLRNLQISCTNGAIGRSYFQKNPITGGHRLSFDFRSKGVEQADIRCVLVENGVQASEIWTYRWTA
ncbi:MAG: glucan biosynthesis protein [Hyphomicrobiales bacterium]|nr:glucan biosynthesis protein [Hyphomicrobiales bacterium]